MGRKRKPDPGYLEEVRLDDQVIPQVNWNVQQRKDDVYRRIQEQVKSLRKLNKTDAEIRQELIKPLDLDLLRDEIAERTEAELQKIREDALRDALAGQDLGPRFKPILPVG